MYVLRCSEGWAIVAPSAEALGHAIAQAECRDLDFGFAFETLPMTVEQWLALGDQAKKMTDDDMAVFQRAALSEQDRLTESRG